MELLPTFREVANAADERRQEENKVFTDMYNSEKNVCVKLWLLVVRFGMQLTKMSIMCCIALFVILCLLLYFIIENENALNNLHSLLFHPPTKMPH